MKKIVVSVKMGCLELTDKDFQMRGEKTFEFPYDEYDFTVNSYGVFMYKEDENEEDLALALFIPHTSLNYVNVREEKDINE